jgi:glycerol-3-phosphate dehydrogenase (NAD(P)+)
MSTVAVLGAGSFGTTLAIHLADTGHDARLWGRDRAEMELPPDHAGERQVSGWHPAAPRG